MDMQTLIITFILNERVGIIVLLAVFLYFMYSQTKQQINLQKEIKNIRTKLEKLGDKTDTTSSDLSSLNVRISNLSGVVSDANSVAENTKKELSMLADGINSETVFNRAIEMARLGSNTDSIILETGLTKDQVDTIVRFHGNKV
jgi:septal ring factor EnvC (AmiA/AmiB activator)